MARFPETEPEIAALAMLVAQGLARAPEDFPAPPVSAADLQVKLETYNARLAATVVSETTFRKDHAAKDEALDDLTSCTKANLKYAEFVVRDAPEKLNQLGWGKRRDSVALEAPGEVRDMSIEAEGDTWVVLRWNVPVKGGAVSVYRIQRKKDTGPWEDAGISTQTEQLMSNQPRGIELNFRVLAVNKAGTGQPSATVTLVL